MNRGGAGVSAWTLERRAAQAERMRAMATGRVRRGAENSHWKNGASSHPLYWIWQDMKRRCHYPGHKRFHDYGGRGITVCSRWRESFWSFVADMGERPRRTCLDRINNDRGYSQDNCRWADLSTSSRNRRTYGWERRERNAAGRFV